MIPVTDFFQNQIASKQGVEWFRKLIIQNLKGTEDIDLSSFITRWGTITRKLQYTTGKFTAGSHSFSIQDSKRVGKFLFQLNQEFGTEFWMDKEYNINFGFLNGQTEDTIGVGTFRITSKREDRINGSIGISSKDVMNELADFTVCTKIKALDVFDYSDSNFQDLRSFQQVIKFGEHKLINNSGDKSSLRDRKTPFSATLGFPNIASAKRKDSGGAFPFQASHQYWYFPFEHAVSDFKEHYNGVGKDGENLRVYIWDYIDDLWIALDSNEYQSSWEIRLGLSVNANANFLRILTPSSITLGDKTADWDTYINGSSASDWEDDNPDPAVCIESKHFSTFSGINLNSNPVAIIGELISGNHFTNLADATLDFSSFITPDTDFSFDKTFQFFENANAKVNTNFAKETSLLKVIEEIAKVGVMFFYSVPKTPSSDLRLKLQVQQPFNACVDTAKSNESFSTKDYISNYDLTTTSDSRFDQVNVSNFDSSISGKESFDVKVTGSGSKKLQVGSDSNPKAYLYNSAGMAQAISSRFFNWLNEPSENVSINVGKAGVPVEIFDFIDVHDEITDQTLNVQVYETRNNLDNGETRIVGRRFDGLESPDPDEPLKKWAFATVGGTHTGSNNSTNLIDSAAKFQTWEVKSGDTIRNDTDGSEGVVSSIVSETELVASLSGGTDDDFDTNDVYYMGVECASFATNNVAPSGKATAPHTGESWHSF